MYSFVRTEPFHGLSSLYEVYDSNNTYVTTMVVGYDNVNDIYFLLNIKAHLESNL